MSADEEFKPAEIQDEHLSDVQGGLRLVQFDTVSMHYFQASPVAEFDELGKDRLSGGAASGGVDYERS